MFDRRLQQRVASEPAPPFQLWSNTRFVTDDSDQIPGSAPAQHSRQLRQQTGREGLAVNVEVDISFHFQCACACNYCAFHRVLIERLGRSEEHTSELQSRGLISYAVFCL